MAAEEDALRADERKVRADEGRQGKAMSPDIPQPQRRPAHQAEGVSVAAGAHPIGDALELVRAASKALERMHARCCKVETFTSQQADYYSAELAVAQAGLQQLRQQATAHEEAGRKLNDCVGSEAALRQQLREKLDETTDKSKQSQKQLRETEKRALVAEDWLRRFQDEIESAFGDISQIRDEIGSVPQTGTSVPLPQG